MPRLTSALPAPRARRTRSSLVASTSRLRYVDAQGAGITRRRCRGVFIYLDVHGRRIHDADEIARIEKLAIPPAYRDVWICPDRHGHLQATGRDARGRKQYRYHPEWIARRSADKFCRLAAFARALPKIRAAVEGDLAQRGLRREKVMATVIDLLDRTFLRVGNSRYLRENRSFGLTTLEDRHVDIGRDQVGFHFRGKGGVEHHVAVSERRLTQIVRRCRDLPGQPLFQYLDDDGNPHPVSSDDVNAYLKAHGRGDFSAKDYRTWAASVLALAHFRQRSATGVDDAAREVAEVVALVAQRLGNTPAVCRKCYIHPALVDAFVGGELAGLAALPRRRHLSGDEAALRAFLGALETRCG